MRIGIIGAGAIGSVVGAMLTRGGEDVLNGYVAAQGRRVGVNTPFNDAVVEIVKRLGVGFKPDPKNLEPLVRMCPP